MTEFMSDFNGTHYAFCAGSFIHVKRKRHREKSKAIKNGGVRVAYADAVLYV